MRDKAHQLKPLLTDRNALSQCDTEIRECQKSIDYFTEELAKIESKRESEPSSDISTTQINAADRSSIPPRPNSVGGSSSSEPRDIKKYSTLGKDKKKRRKHAE